MTAKRGRTESPDSAGKRDPSSPSRRSSSIQKLDGSSSLETSRIATSRASTSTPSSKASSSIGRSSSTRTNSHALSSIADSPELNPSFLRSAKQTAAVIDTNARGTGLATPSTDGERTHEGTIVSPYVANNFRYSPSASLTVYAPTESFPMLRSGDVLIKTAIQPARKWQLHSHILMRHSPWFARAMKDTVQSGGESPTWFLFMIEDVNGSVSLVRHSVRGKFPAIEDTQRDALSRIVVKSEDSTDAAVPTRETPASTPGLEDRAVARTPGKDYSSLVDIYDQVFGAFYNVPLSAPPVDITAALSHAERVVEIADNLGCLHLLTAPVGNTLLQYRQSLFTAIKDDPARWLLLALSLQNDNLYTESLIHIIGAHPCWPWPTKKHSLPAELRRLVAQKSRALDQMCLETERDLLTLTIDVRSRPVVPEVSSQFDTWFVVSTFRHVLATEITSLENDRRASLKRGAVFRKIYKGGCEYMDTEVMRRYMEEIMPSAVGTVGEDLAMLKDFAKLYVRELAGNELMLDIEANPVGYLTCAKVGAEDIPWRAARFGGV